MNNFKEQVENTFFSASSFILRAFSLLLVSWRIACRLASLAVSNSSSARAYGRNQPKRKVRAIA